VLSFVANPWNETLGVGRLTTTSRSCNEPVG
jgi:hypothetical protein